MSGSAKTRHWIFWVTLVLGVFVFLAASSVFLVIRSLRLAPTPVVAGSTLTVEMRGALPEEDLFAFNTSLFGVQQVTVKDVLDSMARAGRDARVTGLLLRLRGTEVGWARIEEIRSALAEFKGSGKPSAAYLEFGGNADYYLAIAADKVYLHPQGILDVRGLTAEVTFLKGALDKLGVEAEFEQIGAYKNAPDPFTRESMSEAHRRSLQELVDEFHARLVESIAAARQLEPGAVRAALDRGPLTAAEALEARLVDELVYEDEVAQRLRAEEPFHPLSVSDYRQSQTERGLSLAGRPKVALIYAEGLIVGGESDDDPLVGKVIGSDTLAKAFSTVREDDSIKAVVLRINSPGGSDVASDTIWREATLTKEKKPVVVSMSDVAASGGYWIATAAHAIVAQPSTLTGSIGIFAGKFNLQGLYQKLNIHVDKVERGRGGDFWTSSRPFTEAERERLRLHLRAGYQRFLEKVAAARQKKPEEVDALGQGRVWTGAQALERGLVDDLGGLDRALELARSRAKLPPDAEIDLLVYPEERGLLELLMRRLTARASDIALVGSLEPVKWLRRSAFLRLLTDESRLALMPYFVRIR